MDRHSITLEEKLKASKEVESIYALAKKWQRLTPDEKILTLPTTSRRHAESYV